MYIAAQSASLLSSSPPPLLAAGTVRALCSAVVLRINSSRAHCSHCTSLCNVRLVRLSTVFLYSLPLYLYSILYSEIIQYCIYYLLYNALVRFFSESRHGQGRHVHLRSNHSTLSLILYIVLRCVQFRPVRPFELYSASSPSSSSPAATQVFSTSVSVCDRHTRTRARLIIEFSLLLAHSPKL